MEDITKEDILAQAEIEKAITGAFKLGLELSSTDKNLSLLKIAVYSIIMDEALRRGFKDDEKGYAELIKITRGLLSD